MTAFLRLLSRRGEPSRRVRRMMVAFAAAAIPALALITFAAPRDLRLLILVGGGAVLLVPLIVVTEFRRNVFKRANADERERRRRDEAYRLSYRVVEYAVPLVALLFAFRLEFHESSWLPVWFVAFQYVIFLPYMFFAWREPDVVD
jgi:hypothetical protein